MRGIFLIYKNLGDELLFPNSKFINLSATKTLNPFLEQAVCVRSMMAFRSLRNTRNVYQALEIRKTSHLFVFDPFFISNFCWRATITAVDSFDVIDTLLAIIT